MKNREITLNRKAVGLPSCALTVTDVQFPAGTEGNFCAEVRSQEHLGSPFSMSQAEHINSRLFTSSLPSRRTLTDDKAIGIQEQMLYQHLS